MAGLVPFVECGHRDGDGTFIACTSCHFFAMVEKIWLWLIIISSIIATLVLMYAGFKLVTAGGNTEAWTSAKKFFFNAIIGLIILLAAWVIVDTIIKAVAGTELGVWNRIEDECARESVPVGR